MSSTRGPGEAGGAPELEPGAEAEAEEAEDTQMKKLSSELRTFNQSAEVRASNKGSLKKSMQTKLLIPYPYDISVGMPV